MSKIYKNKYIENLTEQRLQQYENKNGKIKEFCVPIDKIIEDSGLSILYDEIEEKQGESILGGLNIKKKVVVINESHMKTFEAKPGLEHFTKAHELGHWDMFVRKELHDESATLGFEIVKPECFYRNSRTGRITILQNAWRDEDIYGVYRMYNRRKDHPYVESAVNRFASFLLMPEYLIREYINMNDTITWHDLYKMKEKFKVTISALCLRLQKLGIIYIKDKKIYKSKDEAMGQEMLKI